MYNNPLTFKISRHNIQEGSRKRSQSHTEINTTLGAVSTSDSSEAEDLSIETDVSVHTQRKSVESDVSSEEVALKNTEEVLLTETDVSVDT